jgi:cephalosporin hydroxylase
MSGGTLHQYFLKNFGKPIHKLIHYFDIYEQHFDRFRGTSPVMLEIGVGQGGSVAMWKDYFGPGSKIVGLDTNPSCVEHNAEGIDIIIGSQSDISILGSVFQKYRQIDIILDDGSHVMSDMIKTFEVAYPRLKDGGVYMVEDTHACYWDEFGGGLKRPGSFHEFVKDKVDELNATHARGSTPVTEFTRNTHSISCYDSVVVFEKRKQGNRQTLVTQAM